VLKFSDLKQDLLLLVSITSTNDVDKGIKYYENLIVIGDLNYDLLCAEKSQTLDDLCDIFDLTNIIKELNS
jgi:hypothetical protein